MTLYEKTVKRHLNVNLDEDERILSAYDKILNDEKTRCSICGYPLNSKQHKENCEGKGKGKGKGKKKGKFELQDIPGHQGWTRYKDRDAKKEK